MAAKLPEFKPLPHSDHPQSGGRIRNPRQAQPVEYRKKTTRTSHVNPRVDPQKSQQLSYDPHARRQWSAEPGVVHTTRSLEPDPFDISDELKKRHDLSSAKYPELNLSKAEYVVKEVYRHWIGLFTPIIGSAAIIVVLLLILAVYPFMADSSSNGSALPSFFTLLSFTLPVIVIVLIFAYIAVWVYLRNRFFITNESVMQEIQHSLFSKRAQTASLGSIEDVSYAQNGIIPTMFNYGHIRMSTEGEESTYRFYYVDNPRKQVAILTNAVEDFKNGRPVTGHEEN